MGCTRTICEGLSYWNIKGWGHFVVDSRPNRLHFKKIAPHHISILAGIRISTSLQLRRVSRTLPAQN